MNIWNDIVLFSFGRGHRRALELHSMLLGLTFKDKAELSYSNCLFK